ncbi:forkhead box protein F1-B-like, partial [Actinia tenebrosa]|uniref:Forkhead box protein F1-B-like n=1 Tax=Actinia tenebrosa TaxID=6105 RepID=A0A6P8ID71_ACTTE
MEDKSKIAKESTMKRRKDDGDVSVHRMPLQHKTTPLTFKAIISVAILSSPIKKATLAQIYQFIQHAFNEFTKSRAGWKNTVRHNLSIHECFVKGGLAPPGKSCYWQIHENYAESFSQGDFSRRQVKIISKGKRVERRLSLTTGEKTRAGIFRGECHDIPSQNASRRPTQIDSDGHLAYSAWRASEEERKMFIAEVSPFCERYYCDGKQLC